MNDLLTNIIEVIVSSPRLTGELSLDGALVMDTAAQAVVDPESDNFDSMGIGIKMNANGCVQLEAVKNRIAELLASDDPIENKAGAEANQWYGFFVPGHTYTDYQKGQLSKNLETPFAMAIAAHRIVYLPFQRFNERFINSTTGEKKDDRPTSAELRGDRLGNNRWVRNPEYNAGIVPNALAVSNGNASNPDNPTWSKDFGSKVGQVMVDFINKELDRAVRGVGPMTGFGGSSGDHHVHHPKGEAHEHGGGDG